MLLIMICIPSICIVILEFAFENPLNEYDILRNTQLIQLECLRDYFNGYVENVMQLMFEYKN